MGLEFKSKSCECDVRWSYCGFSELRRSIATFFSIDLDKMDGFNEENDYKGISWSIVKNPIKYFLNHSDCDGIIPPNRLRKIIPELKKYNQINENERLEKLIIFMELCIKLNERLVFC